MVKRVISQLPGKPKVSYAHSPVIKAGDFVFITARWGGKDSQGRPIKGLEEQTRQCIKNVNELLEAAGATLADVVKANIFLKNQSDWDNVCHALSSYFPAGLPPRTVHIDSVLHPDGLVEIDFIAYCPSDKSGSMTKQVISQLPERPNLEWNHISVIKAGDFVFTTGRWGGVDDQGKPLKGIEAQTRRCLDNMKELLSAAGATMDDAVKVNILLKNPSDWEKMEETYKSYFIEDAPVRTLRMVGSSHTEGLIAMDCMSYCPSDKSGSIAKNVISQIPGGRKSGYPQSAVIKAGDFVFTSGRGGIIDKQGARLIGIEAQTKQCLENVKEMLQVAGASLSDVVRSCILLENPDDFAKMEEVYRCYFSKDEPVRTTEKASGHHARLGGVFELDCIAYCPPNNAQRD